MNVLWINEENMFQDRLFKKLVLNGIEIIILIVFHNSMSLTLQRAIDAWRETTHEYVETL